jgi:fatty acid desaturase
MKLEALFRSVVTALCLTAGGTAVIAVIYGMLILLFWSIPVVAAIFALLWVGQSYLLYQHADPEWQDRARILVRIDDGDEEED